MELQHELYAFIAFQHFIVLIKGKNETEALLALKF